VCYYLCLEVIPNLIWAANDHFSCRTALACIAVVSNYCCFGLLAGGKKLLIFADKTGFGMTSNNELCEYLLHRPIHLLK